LAATETTPSAATKFTTNKSISRGYNYNRTSGVDGEEVD